jgi:hypothetical protein
MNDRPGPAGFVSVSRKGKNSSMTTANCSVQIQQYSAAPVYEFSDLELWERANKLRLSEYTKQTQAKTFYRFILEYRLWVSDAVYKEGDPYADVSYELLRDSRRNLRDDVKLFNHLKREIPENHENLIDELWLQYQSTKLGRKVAK